MFQYALKRLLGILPTLAIVAFLVFFFVHLLPGDPARLAAGQDATPETVQMVREDLGLDKPLHVQFVRWAGGIGPSQGVSSFLRRSTSRMIIGVKISCIASSILPPGTTSVLARDMNESCSMLSR